MSSVSSSDSRSSGLTRTKEGRPLRVTRMRSWSCSTRSASSDRWDFASENGTVSVTGQDSDLSSATTQPEAAVLAIEDVDVRE